MQVAQYRASHICFFGRQIDSSESCQIFGIIEYLNEMRGGFICVFPWCLICLCCVLYVNYEKCKSADVKLREGHYNTNVHNEIQQKVSVSSVIFDLSMYSIKCVAWKICIWNNWRFRILEKQKRINFPPFFRKNLFY